ncbi:MULTISPECIES: IclR family transcriptional regulator C-terminal domain-containing protein [unclassified Mesorhizobium]|uniref:IclR family transcriptional regulator domain-containing protein n=1 Tax=unclassified Mesorhizobium TaxID=325217 RepID=UPI0011276AFF|nr:MULTISPECIES: IclR family transcriptional regulator C-terminal domain-containing protein [unclassified Mesorhizobium]TPK59833.1 helix-turn-helix domain-containing protein [Mesorhizobium sp. B2-5-1]TPM66814.1 helix-turn-helix domain-containing protein [Mesorhizobium sp. B2-1-9]TPM88882.1 helix-turn-helix domain-containing protein [Mesorhizobium sp. B2-1-4]TPN08288.1 helix-turn-helix domain-containing protein [Mesorhizobium sp. B2-1-2]TPN69149.1 helix-turn-helix domain-containing protein [Mes
MPISERDTMGGLAKGLSVIETFTVERPRQSITDVANASGLDRATARRCLLTLSHLGYADYDGKFFTLTPRVLRLGTACLATMPLPHLVQPLLDDLSERLGESSSVSILDGTDVVYVARAAQRKVMSIALMPGSRLPAYCTSMGRVLLAAMPPERAAHLLSSHALPARTAHTLTDPDTILAELGRVRTQGFALIDQEVELGLRSIAVPLMTVRGTVIAAVNVGVAATHVGVSNLVALYLEPLCALQAELRAVLR